MKILAIETSCDETAIALLEANGGLRNPKFKILKNLVASQIKIHRPFGGVVPNLAKREHLKNLPILYRQVFANSKSKIQSIDFIAVTVGPGLEPALWTGITFAKQMYADLCGLQRGLTRKKEIKLIGVNHLEGHLYSNIIENVRMNNKNIFPAIALIVSGGHTILIKMDSLVKYKKIGETRDDAVGEAFDKVARLLNLSYPGGPEIEKLAKIGDPNAIDFPRPMLNQNNYDFSFSGLKTSILYYLRDNKNLKKENVAASFQQAAFDVLISKTLRAVKEFNAKSIMISGGVAVNKTLRKEFKLKIENFKLKIDFLAPPKNFCADNAAMIAVAGYINHLRKKNRRLMANGNLNI